MAQSIKNLELGSKIIDSRGNKFIVIAKNHYGDNQTTLISEDTIGRKPMITGGMGGSYSDSEMDYVLNTYYYNEELDYNLKDYIANTEVHFTNTSSSYLWYHQSITTKIFILSAKELGCQTPGEWANPNVDIMHYFTEENRRQIMANGWTRTEVANDNFSMFYYMSDTTDYVGQASHSALFETHPVFNVSHDLLVTDEVANGYYGFIFNFPPVISTIPNIQGNYGSATNITYTVTDNDDNALEHLFSDDNGSSWYEIQPTRVGDRYTYSRVFNELGNHNCRIKVRDSYNNVATSNMFTVSLNSVNPTVNIISVLDRIVTFKVNCSTDSISKVEILVGGTLRKTFTSGFDFNLTYEIDRSHLITGKTTIEIKATSSANLVGRRSLEANKTTYNLPPVGTKIIIGNMEYAITNAVQSGTNQTYTLDKALVTNVSINELIKIMQDTVKVKCAISNVSDSKEFVDMKLVKAKHLKGAFEGYVEEKYELQGEGRYSTVKLETERFNNNVASEIIELQQHFDYIED